MSDDSRFTDMVGVEPPTKTQPDKPTALQIAANMAALGPGKHALNDAQQKTVFGAVLFLDPVEWNGAEIVSGDLAMTPEDAEAAAQNG